MKEALKKENFKKVYVSKKDKRKIETYELSPQAVTSLEKNRIVQGQKALRNFLISMYKAKINSITAINKVIVPQNIVVPKRVMIHH
jgi:hypothetical protein